MVTMSTAPDLNAAASIIISEFRARALRPPLIRLEGFCGVGKTRIGTAIAQRAGAVRISGDSYARKLDPTPAYPACIRQDELDRDIEKAIRSESVVILDAVCLNDIAPEERWGRGFVVYVKRLDFNNQHNPMWHGGFDLENEPPAEQPHRSVHQYHLRHRPHETADLIIELPEELHRLPEGAFSREFCFDPPGAL
jgi:hypothetical protein